jgi:transposase
MEERLLLSDKIWRELEPLIEEAKHPAGAPPRQGDREFIEAVLYIARTGSPWRDLPKELGHWHNVYVRFRRWEKAGTWRRLWKLIRQNGSSRVKEVYIDSTMVRAHHHASGALKKKGRKPSDVLAGA